MADSKQSGSSRGKKSSGSGGSKKSSSSGGRKRSSSSGGSKASGESASSKSGGSKKSGESSRSGNSSGSSKESSGKITARDIVESAAEQLPQLIGRPVEGVLAVEKDGSEWAVRVEVLELERVPNTTDVLGQYEVTLDGDGDVIAARRTRRYTRSQSGDD